MVTLSKLKQEVREMANSKVNEAFRVIPDTVNLFVYGSLKPQFGNYRLISSHLQICAGFVEGVQLWNLGIGFPAVTLVDDKSVVTFGYLVTFHKDSEVLKRVDQLEGYHPDSLFKHYEKSEVTVKLDKGIETKAFIYHYTDDKLRTYQNPEPIKNGIWTKEILNKNRGIGR